MAFQKAFVDDFGVNPATAYFRVRRVIVDNFPTYLNSQALFTAEIEIYISQTDYQVGKAPLTVKTFQLSTTDNQAVQQGLMAAYAWIKTLPEFQGAIDVIE